ncbi:MAG: pyridoxal-phosphate-dependent aminotransferase family protein [Dehalococcoidia bacterium]
MNLRVPGPTPCPPEVLDALSRPMINHRGPEFAALLKRATEGVKPAFGTTGDVVILTSSGTGALEAAITNTLSPADEVLSLSIGYFGDRFAQIAENFGAKVTRLTVEPGHAAGPEDLRTALRDHGGVKAVLLTHNETSTGVTNDLQALAAEVREAGPLLLVDAISSLSSIPVRMDDWGLDLVLSGSQKGWMVPPGLAFVAVSERAWQAARSARMPRYYFDLRKAKESADKGQTPATPSVSLFFAMDVALDLLEREGWPAVYDRHRRVAAHLRSGLIDLGLQLFADQAYASNTVTTVRVPDGIDASALIRALREQHGIVIAGGQGALTGKILRIGHLGYVEASDMSEVLEALRTELPRLAHPAAAAVAG